MDRRRSTSVTWPQAAQTGFGSSGLHAWDIAAGVLILAEAHGHISDYRGNAITLDGAQIVASNGHVHAAMIEVLRQYA